MGFEAKALGASGKETSELKKGVLHYEAQRFGQYPVIHREPDVRGKDLVATREGISEVQISIEGEYSKKSFTDIIGDILHGDGARTVRYDSGFPYIEGKGGDGIITTRFQAVEAGDFDAHVGALRTENPNSQDFPSISWLDRAKREAGVINHMRGDTWEETKGVVRTGFAGSNIEAWENTGGAIPILGGETRLMSREEAMEISRKIDGASPSDRLTENALSYYTSARHANETAAPQNIQPKELP